MIDHQDAIQLIIGYTCVGAFVFTVVVTCLSLIGWVKLADRGQQKKLFAIIIIEIAIVGVGYFSGLLKFSPEASERSLGITYDSYELFEDDLGHSCPDEMLHVRELLKSEVESSVKLHRILLNTPPVRTVPVIYEQEPGLLAFNYCVGVDRAQKVRAMIVSEDGRVSDLIEYTVDSSLESSIIRPLAESLSRR